jgi:CheY-like chemotaxis protein
MRPQVLIVDDCAPTRAALAIALRAAGYATAEAEDGGEALALLRAAAVPPAVVLLDLVLPVVSGWQFLVERAKDQALPAVPVLVFSSVPGLDHDVLRRMGAAEVIGKPATIGELLDALRRHCRPESS